MTKLRKHLASLTAGNCAQMDFGSIEAPADEKEFMSDEDRFKVLK